MSATLPLKQKIGFGLGSVLALAAVLRLSLTEACAADIHRQLPAKRRTV